jgi:ribosomal protein L12E/L44/L45/RPP1/RPP2
MVGGFNTNIRYRGRTFHVQTEDSGKARPKVVTLLYEGGVILTAKKSSYEEHLESDDLESVVRELMEHQHRFMVQALKDGELDEVLDGGKPREKAKAAPGRKSSRRQQPAAFGEGLISDKPLDELVLDVLAS